METEDFLYGIILTIGILLLIGIVLLVIATYYAIMSAILMLAWNYVMPYAFNLPKITFLHAFCLILIAKILFSLTATLHNGNKK
jgi:hypothetical protein